MGGQRLKRLTMNSGRSNDATKPSKVKCPQTHTAFLGGLQKLSYPKFQTPCRDTQFFSIEKRP